jgi:hypothetical protein
MHTCSYTKSDDVSEIYSSQEVRKAHPCNQSLSKLLGMHDFILEGCEAFRSVVTGGGKAQGEGVTFSSPLGC